MSNKLEMFNDLDNVDIQSLAKGMNEIEALAYYGIDDISELGPADSRFFRLNFKRGRAMGKHDAVRSLFKSMTAKNPQAALSYLTRFGEEWPTNDTDKPGTRAFKISFED